MTLSELAETEDLLSAARSTAERVDEADALLDVLRGEIEVLQQTSNNQQAAVSAEMMRSCQVQT